MIVLTFFDGDKVVFAMDAAFVISYSPERIEYVADPGGLQKLEFGTKCNILSRQESDAYMMLMNDGVNVDKLSDLILEQYL